MDMTEGQRADLAARIESKRLSDYGTRRAAYNAAQVNAATWTKAETGQSDIAEYSLVAIIKTLWPETGGDWRRLTPPLGAEDRYDALERAIRETVADEGHRQHMLDALEAERAEHKRQQERGAS